MYEVYSCGVVAYMSCRFEHPAVAKDMIFAWIIAMLTKQTCTIFVIIYILI